MGKSKSKKSQPKRYPTPTDKYLVVTDPWGGVPIQEPNFFNNVTAWFEVMFKPKYPGARPSAIFYQWTNKNIVVEIPDHIDVGPYLGTHYWSIFLAPQYCQNVGTRASYIYEFDTKLFPIPAAQGGWTPGYAQYTKIRPNFDVKDPYPAPFPAPNSPLPFAKKLPPGKVGQVQPLPPLPPLPELDFNDDKSPSQQDALPNQGRTKEEEEEGVVSTRRVSDPRKRSVLQPRDTTQPRTAEINPQIDDTTVPQPPSIPTLPPPTSEPPLALPSPRKRKKMDPYEEEEAAINLLRQSTTTPAAAATTAVKQELLVDDDDTLLRHEEKEEYKPSRELLDAINSLPQLNNSSSSSGTVTVAPVGDDDDLPDFVDDEDAEEGEAQLRIKPEPPSDDDEATYLPSAEWAQAFASLTGSAGAGADDDDEGDGGAATYQPSEDLMSALASLPPGVVDLGPSSATSTTTAAAGIGGMRGRVKMEPVEDDDRSVLSAARPRKIATITAGGGPQGQLGRRGVKREPSDEYDDELVKRVKLGHVGKKVNK